MAVWKGTEQAAFLSLASGMHTSRLLPKAWEKSVPNAKDSSSRSFHGQVSVQEQYPYVGLHRDHKEDPEENY